MQSATIVLKNEVGLHARPASLLIQAASKFKSEVLIKKGERSCNAKSIIAILSLGASMGDALTITAKGEDEIEAIKTVVELIEGFKE